MPKKSRQQHQVQVARAQHFSGPIPRPGDLEHYEQITPGLADRIVKMAEDQSQHRQDLERRTIKGNLVSQILGQAFGFLLGVGAIGCGTFLILNEKSPAGLTTILSGLAGLVGVFIYGKKTQSKEIEARRRD